MEWTCCQCGQYAQVDTWREMSDLGWTLDVFGNSVCVSCTMRQWPATAPTQHDARASTAVGWGAARFASGRARVARPHPHLVLVKQQARL